MPWTNAPSGPEVKFHAGCLQLYKDSLPELFNLWFEKYKAKCDRIYVIGHSLGGSGAVLVADYLATADPSIREKMYVFRTGSVRCGNRQFTEEYHQKLPKRRTLHLLHENDTTALVPPSYSWNPFYDELGTTMYLLTSANSEFSHFIEEYIESTKKMIS